MGCKITLYHGSRHIVDKPVCAFGRDNLDFGKGFYLSADRIQAEAWARRVAAMNIDSTPVVNIYSFAKEEFMVSGRCLVFPEYDETWLNFIVESRMGQKPWEPYDYIEGGVANDRVIDTVNLYIAGLMDISTALGRLSMHQPNNQICLSNQELTDKHLYFEGYDSL